MEIRIPLGFFGGGDVESSNLGGHTGLLDALTSIFHVPHRGPGETL